MMFKPQVPLALAIAGLSISPFQTPIPPASPFAVPDGPLPWALPLLPDTTITLSAPTLQFDAIEHTTEFADIQTEFDSRAASVESTMTQLADSFELFAGTEGVLPDLTAGQTADTGLDPNASGSMSLADFNDQLTTDVAVAFSWGRVAQTIGLAFLVNLFATIFITLSWQFFVRWILFLIQLFDGIVSLFDKLKKIIFIVAG